MKVKVGGNLTMVLTRWCKLTLSVLFSNLETSLIGLSRLPLSGSSCRNLQSSPLLQRPFLRKSRQICLGFSRRGAATLWGPLLRDETCSGASSPLSMSEEDEPLEDVRSSESVEEMSELESDIEMLEFWEALSMLQGGDSSPFAGFESCGRLLAASPEFPSAVDRGGSV